MIAVALRIAVVASLALAVCLRAPPAAAETIGGWYLLTFEDRTQANGTRQPPSRRHQLAFVYRMANEARLYIAQARGALGNNVPIVG